MATLAVVITGLVMWWLLSKLKNGQSTESAKIELDAIRTALSVGVGTGGALALWLAARRQRSTEMQLAETARIAAESSQHLERVAHTTDEDLRERRITELYATAVEQLGSDKAPVRLGGLYALERLAQDNIGMRQTAVNVICAYLRMPYSPPKSIGREYAYSTSPGDSMEDAKAYEELQVRRAVQQVIINHFRIGSPRKSREELPQQFWDKISIDLTGATLVDFRFQGCRVERADFSRARFHSVARFDQTIFNGEAWFFLTEFGANAFFTRTTFLSRAIFTRCDFGERLSFRETQFNQDAFYGWAKFRGVADFTDVTFCGPISFERYQLDNRTDPVDKQGLTVEIFDFTGARIRPGEHVRDQNNKTNYQLPNGWVFDQSLANIRRSDALSLQTQENAPAQKE